MLKGLVERSLIIGLSFWCICTQAQVASSEIYDIDPEHTAAALEYRHWGLSRQRGQFNKTSGTIEFNPESESARIQIEIDVNSVTAGTEAFNEMLRSPDFFDAANHPRIFFKSSQAHFDKDRLTEIEGELTIKGISKPVALKLGHFHCRFMPVYGTRACGANASANILRSDFNLGRFTPFVGDQIDLHIAVEAIQRKRPQIEPPEFFQR
jgi:polyisoprenoid-binding protein YceI